MKHSDKKKKIISLIYFNSELVQNSAGSVTKSFGSLHYTGLIPG